jgi:hypothetical protein
MLIWADFPSGQRGLYGTDTAKMLDGVWAAVLNATNIYDALVSDPDPAIGSEGVVFQAGPNAAGSGASSQAARMALPIERTTLGLAMRIWLDQLPSDPSYHPFVAFRDSSNSGIVLFKISTTGQIVAYSGGDQNGGGGTLIQASNPCVTANAYTHCEFKVTKGAGTGAIEVRVNGSPVLTLSGLTLSASNIAQFAFGTHDGGGGIPPSSTVYIKDLVVWDTTGSEVNDFVGAVAVYDIVPDGDVSLNWTPANGATGHNLIRDDYPTGTLTATANFTDGNLVVIDGVNYRMSTGSLDSSSPAGTGANPWRVLIGADTAASLLNLFKAIGATGVAGTTYSTALTAHPTANADGVSATQLDIKSKLLNDDMTQSETGANSSWYATTLTKGPSDTSYISADNSPPAASIFTMTDLPDDVISVKGVIPIGRMYKSDGGDCTVEMAVSPDNISYDAGSDRPITVAPTYWWDISTLSPATGVAWTPDEVNSMRFRIDRTT